MDSTTDKYEPKDSLENALKAGRICIPGAIYFNSLELADQKGALAVYDVKHKQHELENLDFETGIECVAKLYKAQKDAFLDVLVRQKFEPTNDAQKDYSGRIAVLTHYGTVSIFGILTRIGRTITMSRIHTPSMNFSDYRGNLSQDCSIWGRVKMTVPRHPVGKFNSSTIRGLAINPNRADGDEVQSHAQCISQIAVLSDSMYETMMRPVKVPAAADVPDNQQHPILIP